MPTILNPKVVSFLLGRASCSPKTRVLMAHFISNPLTSELLSLSYLSLCPLCPLWFNHSDTTGIDIICEAGKPVAEGRGGHATIKFTQDVNSKVRSPF